MTNKISSMVSSPLSDPDTDTDSEEYYAHDRNQRAQQPPAKRQRLSPREPHEPPPPPQQQPQDTLDRWDISSDSSASVPGSPAGSRLDDDDHIYPQVSVCEWEGCPAGDLLNMDRLVDHLNAAHIDGKTKSYLCEWKTCSRRNMPHASGYALRAHMRSHTREKPFYCLVPECDRCFTRSDALAKHMRIVHETEALRPSDPVPKTLQAAPKSQAGRLKLNIKQHPLSNNGVPTRSESPIHSPNLHTHAPDETSLESLSQLFTPEELSLGFHDLHRLLRRQLNWAEEDHASINQQVEALESLRRREWEEKEILLDQVASVEIEYHQRREAILQNRNALEAAEKQMLQEEMAMGGIQGDGDDHEEQAVENIEKKEVITKDEHEIEDEREAAAVLASLAAT